MPAKLTHSQCCAIVCFVCGNESGKKGNSKVSSTEVQLIRDHVMSGYDPNDERFDTKNNLTKCLTFKIKVPHSYLQHLQVQAEGPPHPAHHQSLHL